MVRLLMLNCTPVNVLSMPDNVNYDYYNELILAVLSLIMFECNAMWGIYVDREYPLDVEHKRKTLLPILRAAKRSSEYKKQSKLEDDKIVLKGRKYGVNTLNQLPEELNVFKVTTKENADTVGYFGEINPLSNFYPATFTYDGVPYISSEQFIQASKAKYFGDNDTYNQIMGCSTSLDCKRASRSIRNVDIDRWNMVAGDICQPGI